MRRESAKVCLQHALSSPAKADDPSIPEAGVVERCVFGYAVPITKGKYDIVQEFRFGGGTSFNPPAGAGRFRRRPVRR